MNYAQGYLDFVKKSVTAFHAVTNIKEKLLKAGYVELDLTTNYKVVLGGKYFVTQNDSSVIAFKTPKDTKNFHFQMVASHTDSPTYKLKPKYNLEPLNLYNTFTTEMYGVTIASTWLDRPLSVAGRVIISKDNKITTKLVDIDKDLVVIPNLSAHINPDREGQKYNIQNDLPPLFASKDSAVKLINLLALEADVNPCEIVDGDLFLYTRHRGTMYGANDEFMIAPQLDDLAMAYGTLEGFIEADSFDQCSVYCAFDNEEVGSRTRQGAASTFLKDTLTNIINSLGIDVCEYQAIINRSFLISADNAHASHPNRPERTDSLNPCHLNKGIAIKYSAMQSYTTDALSACVFKQICNSANALYQEVTNRSDVRGGSTLGPVSIGQVSCSSLDIGLPQFAMHSSSETVGCEDFTHLVNALREYFNTNIVKSNNGFEFIK